MHSLQPTPGSTYSQIEKRGVMCDKCSRYDTLVTALCKLVNEEIAEFSRVGGGQSTENCAPANKWWDDCQVLIMPNAADSPNPLICLIITGHVGAYEVDHLDRHGFNVTFSQPGLVVCQFRPVAIH